MYTEKIIKREGGSRVKISVGTHFNRGIEYTINVATCKKGKRTWVGTYDSDCYRYRELTMGERRAFEYKSYLKVVTEEELQEARLELWEAMKPTCTQTP